MKNHPPDIFRPKLIQIGNIWHWQGDESCDSIPSVHTTVYTETTNPIPIRNSSSSNTRHQHRCPILHPSACEQTIHCLKLRNIHITYLAETEIMQEDR